MSKALERRAKLREDLIRAAERSISAGGLAGLKTRDLAREIGCANGAVYNLVDDVDELILLVGSRTLARLDAALTEAESAGPPSPAATLVRIAVAYCDFASENLELWRALFEHRMTPGKPIPEWAVSEQMNLFRHIYAPLATLFPKAIARRTRRHRTQPFFRRARHGAARPRTETDRGADRGVAARDRGYREGDGRGIGGIGIVEIAGWAKARLHRAHHLQHRAEWWARFALPTLQTEPHTVSTVDPVVLRAARSVCALAASFSG